MEIARNLPVGAETLSADGVHFRVFAPKAKKVEIVVESHPSASQELRSEENGYFSGRLKAARVGSRYRFRLDGRSELFPDPASRFQPEGPHGPSEVVDPTRFSWTDSSWRGVDVEGQVIYEMHIGTFTREGTWKAAIGELAELALTGISVLEVMPIADFPGRFGWGYDGVNMFAPTRLYGAPDDFRRFVDAAHNVGLGVILDVVYNHIGPDGNYLKQFSDDYFTDRYGNEWGEALNFDGPNARPVREFFIANAGYWIDEYHLDGLRLDATQQIFDASPEHILTAIGRRARAAARGRRTIIVAENETQDVRLVRPVEAGGYGLDGLWNDDYHHSAHVALTGHNEAYYTDYRGDPQEFISAVKYGYLFQGQRYKWQKQRRGTPSLDVPAAKFVVYLDNHDQIANSGHGLRGQQMTSPGRWRALTALTLLAPGTPMLFQGQEFGAATPFLFFADHQGNLGEAVRKGRAQFLSQFCSLATREMQELLAQPSDPATFERCKLQFEERQTHAELYTLHRDLLKLRRENAVFRMQKPRGVDGAVLSSHAFVLRYFAEDGMDRLLLVNLGVDLHLDPAPEPLLAAPAGCVWAKVWSSEDAAYGGCGTPPLDSELNWRIPGEAAVVMKPERAPEPKRA